MNNDQFKKQFFNSLLDLNDEALIMQILPNPELDYFYELMNYLIEHQMEYIKECEKLFKLAINHEEKEEYGAYYKNALKQHKLYIKHRNKRIIKDKIDEIQEDKVTQRDVFYAEHNGKVLLEKDLKDIQKHDNGEELEIIKKLINELKNADLNFNQQKSRKLTNHTSLKDVYELKGNQIRLFYMYVDKYAVIIGGCEKKTQNSDKHMKTIINMKVASYEYRKKLEDNLKNKEYIEKEFQNSKEFENKIMGEKIR